MPRALDWPVLSREQMLAGAQVIESELIVESDASARRPDACGCVRQRVSARCLRRFAAPLLGEHTDEVPAEMGLSPDTIAELRSLLVVA
jgi:crotonobetainyl-CoA:carnitine CoA-transferase CaiB-like acyl-CoA transferase